MMIGAFRDNEVDDKHPLTSLMNNIEHKHGQRIAHIVLQPLAPTHVKDLLAHTFHVTRDQTKSLAKLIISKTQGNPFFILLLLTTFVQEGAVYFNYGMGRWEWDLSKIPHVAVTDNVVEMALLRIQKMQRRTQAVLSLAAAIGFHFDLHTLAVIFKASVRKTAKSLWPAVQGTQCVLSVRFVFVFGCHL